MYVQEESKKKATENDESLPDPRKVATVVKLLRRATEELLLRKITRPLEHVGRNGARLIAAVAELLGQGQQVRARRAGFCE